MKDRRIYPVFIMFNGRIFNEVVIDPHFEENHSEHMSDELILVLVKKMNRITVQFQKKYNIYSYFEIDHFETDGKKYRMVICTEEQKSYIGIVNCYRKGKL